MNPIRVLIADDSVFMRTALTRLIESGLGLKVVGAASHGLEAVEMTAELDPDVVTLDLEMPRMDGLHALAEIMRRSPRPVIVISALSQQGAESVLEALDLGAFDCIGKPVAAGQLDIVQIRDELVAKVRAAAAATWLRRRGRSPSGVASGIARPAAVREKASAPQVIAIGSSTGGPLALQRILSGLPADLPAGVVMVQHMPRGFTGPFARRLDALSPLAVREAVSGDIVEPGVALLAPAGKHLTVLSRPGPRMVVRLQDEPASARHIPSVDVMMCSVAEAFGSRAMGVILTGMGADGALGMKAIHDRGGHTVGQDEASCAVYGMSRAAAGLGALSSVAALGDIAGEIINLSMCAQAVVY